MVNRSKLIQRMKQLVICRPNGSFRGRKAQVFVNVSTSEWKGCVLCRVWFILFIESRVGGLKYKGSMFADDVALSSSHEDPAHIVQDLNDDLALAPSWGGRTDLVFGLKKCQVMWKDGIEKH